MEPSPKRPAAKTRAGPAAERVAPTPCVSTRATTQDGAAPPHGFAEAISKSPRFATQRIQIKSVFGEAALAHEAEVLGATAMQQGPLHAQGMLPAAQLTSAVLQRRVVGKFGLEAEAGDGSFKLKAPKESAAAKMLVDDTVSFEEYELAKLGNKVSVTLDGERSFQTATEQVRAFTVEYVQNAIDVDLADPEEVISVGHAWRHALEFWQSHIKNPEALKGTLGNWHSLTNTWQGEQFKGRDETPGIRNEVDKPSAFEWTNQDYTSGIETDSQDPSVSAQATAGSTLLGLLEVYMEMSSILIDGKPAQGEQRQQVEDAQKRSMQLPDTSALLNLQFLIAGYIKGNGNTKDANTRNYAKEYVTLMSRTSLDLLYLQLSPKAQAVFDSGVLSYLETQQGPLATLCQFRNPKDRVFVKDASKEDVSDLTIERLLLSIIKKQRGEILNTLEPTGEPVTGDALVQRDLAGMGEVHPGAATILQKFGLDNASEMMRGIPGLIFEARSAKDFRLSEMPALFEMLFNSLSRVNQAHAEFDQIKNQKNESSRQLPGSEMTRGAQKPSQKGDDGGCYLTTACVAQRGLPDDCEELLVLRRFRDDVLAPLPVGPELISCYYRQAPGIVAAINAHEDSSAIYARIYEAVLFCVDAIKAGRNMIALAAYCELVIRLEQELGPDVASSACSV